MKTSQAVPLEAQHTPGPWKLWTSNSWRRFGSETTHRVICEPITQSSDGHPDLLFPNGGETGPDAKLIASAPALLEALRNSQANLEHLHELLYTSDHCYEVIATCPCNAAKQFRANEKAIRDAEGKI